jgi:hypothetical protein
VKSPHGSICRAQIGDGQHEARLVSVTMAADVDWVLVCNYGPGDTNALETCDEPLAGLKFE